MKSYLETKFSLKFDHDPTIGPERYPSRKVSIGRVSPLVAETGLLRSLSLAVYMALWVSR